MNLEAIPSAVFFAFFGALALKLIELAELPHVARANIPNFRDPIYWIPFIVLPILGAGLAYAYVMSDVVLKPMLAINVGASAPLAFRAMAQINPLQPKTINLPPGA